MRRLSRLLSRSSDADDAHPKPAVAEAREAVEVRLLLLPAEIVLAIESFLPYESALAMSLTCKTAYELTFRRLKPSIKHNGREIQFLRLLERDFTEMIACPIHERLYSWRKQKSKHYQCPQCIGTKRLSSGSLVICNKGCRSGFYGIFDAQRRLMLRHSLLGAEYGISLRALDHVCKRSSARQANELTPKIVGGNLLLWRTHHFSTKLDFAAAEAFEEAICVHSERNLRALVAGAIKHAKPEVGGAPLNEIGDVWMCPFLLKCSSCATDTRLLYEQSSANEILVRFDVYQDLGGLYDRNKAQRQVLGNRHYWRQQDLIPEEKKQRLREDLEQQYHTRGKVQDSEGCRDSHFSIPAAFFSQWVYHTQRFTEYPVAFVPDPSIPRQGGTAYTDMAEIPFEPFEPAPLISMK